LSIGPYARRITSERSRELKHFRIYAFPLSVTVVGLLFLVFLLGDATMRWFLLGSFAMGGVVAALLRRSSPITLREQNSERPEITMHRIRIGGGVAGLIFAAGACLIFLIGIPALRWFLLGSMAVGAVLAGLLWRWHSKKPLEITDLHEIAGEPETPRIHLGE